MKRMWENICMVVCAAIYGVILAFELPPRWKLRFGQTQEMNTVDGKILLIKLLRRDGKYWNNCQVGINLKNKRIDWSTTTYWLFGRKCHGSGLISVIFVASPFILLLSPVIKLVHKHYARKEQRLGLSRHSQSILKALKGQLEPSIAELLSTAMKNQWQHHCEMSRELTLEEARDLLRQCDLREDFKPEQTRPYADPEARDFYWFNAEGDMVAEGSFYGERNHYVRVLGSWFGNEKADKLIECYKTKTRHEFKVD